MATGAETLLTEIIDLAKPDLECEYPPNYPSVNYGGSGAFVNGSIVICGGIPSISGDKCTSYGGGSFEPFASLGQVSFLPTAIAKNDKLYIIGGDDFNR